MENNVSVRIGKEELKEISKISQDRKISKSAILREILKLGIKQKMLEIALEKFQKNEASAAKAATIAGMSLSEFLEVLHKRGINYHYDIEDLRKDFERVSQHVK